MSSDGTEPVIRRVAALIADADALLITVGAGMGVDAGLPDFRGAKGFWRAYPPLEKLNLSFEEMAQPHWFEDESKMAWAFYGHRQQLYRETLPHAGYRRLRDWAKAMPAGYFVVTSNVDGHFYFADFAAAQILEQHGSIHRYQCTTPCSDAIWQDDPPDLKIDLRTLEAHGHLPRCPECGALARPNVLMFGDVAWVAGMMETQQRRYQQWLESVASKRLVILELGAGTMIATIRGFGERLNRGRPQTTLVRINPDATEADAPAIPLRMTALEALERIEEALPEAFRQRCRETVPVKPAAPWDSEQCKTNPGRILSTLSSQHLQNLKFAKVYSKAWQVTLPSGWVAWVERVDVRRTYLSMLTGIPPVSRTESEIEEARQFVRNNFHGPEPVLIAPKRYDAMSDRPILPPLRFAARIVTYEPISEQDDGSWMNLIWFAEIDDDKSIKAFVEEALAQVDWKKQATGYCL